MNLRRHLLSLLEAYAKARDLAPSYVATQVFGSGTMYRRLVDGSDITVGRLEGAVQWFSNNWPADTAWPEGLPRPVIKHEVAG
jgi:hypothetical protein